VRQTEPASFPSQCQLESAGHQEQGVAGQVGCLPDLSAVYAASPAVGSGSQLAGVALQGLEPVVGPVVAGLSVG